jgi:hypothetical protein
MIINPNPEREFDDFHVICPYCGERYDGADLASEQPAEMICEECEGAFSYYAEYSVTYYAEPVCPPADVEIEPSPVAEALMIDAALDVAADVLECVGGTVDTVGDAVVDIMESIGEMLDL